MNDYYWFWLCNIPGIGNTKIRCLLNCFGSAKKIYSLSETAFMQAGDITPKDSAIIASSRDDINIFNEYNRLKGLNIKFIHQGSDEYPKRLRNIYDPPAGFYVKGKLPSEGKVSVSIIGARACSEYGKNVAYELGKNFAYMGIQVISGMAAGIDAAGHRGCLDGGGYTCAVLGCGADICYPRANIGIYNDISNSGGIISEYPPGTSPHPGQFPVRNRIISALSDVVIVVEARKKSGSLITVDQALEQNREIMAVPGRIGDALSEGCNDLIKMGAMMLTKPDDIKQCSSIINAFLTQKDDKNYATENNGITNNTLATEKNMLYSLLSLSPKNLDELIEQSGYDIQKINELLLDMQLEGLVKETGANCYIRTKL